MNFYISFIVFSLGIMRVFSKSIVLRSDFVQPDLNAVGLQFVVVVNNSLGEDCVVEANPGECCLEDVADKKCSIVKIIGRDVKDLGIDETQTLYLVAPILEPIQRKGYCNIYVDTRPISRLKNVARETVKIKFHSTHKKQATCKYIDEDPFNNCQPVNCVSYYNDKRSFYHPIRKRCVNIPNCYSGNSEDSVIYNPISNKCVEGPAVSKRDIEYVKTLARKHRNTKDLTIISVKDPVAKATAKKEEIEETQDVLPSISSSNDTKENNLNPVLDSKQNKTENTLKCLIDYLSTNRHTLIFLTALVLIQCCLICSLLYCSCRSCFCCKEKKDVKKIYHPQYNAPSDTTPLICPSNLNTEADYEYLSESSNYIDKRIKCYKACQKERKDNVKLSMSDDILSKCINRRDWKRVPRSETITEVDTEINIQKRSKKSVKVNFEEVHEVKPRVFKSSGSEVISLSERELKCHDYDKESSALVIKDRAKYMRGSNSGAPSLEREVQAYFSNDSLDDFLSERGMVFLRDADSKLSFTSGSSAGQVTASSSMSKNREMRNILSLFSKCRVHSDPILTSKTDLELLHIGPAVASSSYDTESTPASRRIKESTSSM